MAKSEVYTPVDAIEVDSFTLDHLQGTPISSLHTPFRDGHIRQFSIVGSGDSGSELVHNGHVINPSRLIRLSDIHRRSYELNFGGSNSSVFWQDEFGNIFGGINIKGNNLESPQIQPDQVSPTGYRVYGMQDSSAMIRVIRASEVLRTHNIDTETLVKIIEPAELPFDGETIPLPEFKRKLVAATLNTGIGIEEIPQISQAMAETTFYMSVRGVQVPERMADLDKSKSYAGVLQMIKRAFSYVNLAECARAKTDPTYEPDNFSVDNPKDIERYFDEYLPRRIAQNYAFLHRKARLVHFYPHSGNISIVGSIYDLDSMKGEPLGLGDDPITTLDIVQDIGKLDGGNYDFPKLEGIVGEITGEGDTFRANFFKTYFKLMGWEGDILHFANIISLIGTGNSKPNQELISYFKDQLPKNLNLEYELNLAEIIKDAISNLTDDNPAELPDELEDRLSESFESHLQNLFTIHFEMGLRDAGYSDEELQNLSISDFSGLYSLTESSKIMNQIKVQVAAHSISNKSINFSNLSSDIKAQINHKFAKLWKLDQDVAENIDLIMDIFGEFGDLSADKLLPYYLDKFIEQTGIDLVLPYTREDLLKTWHQQDQQSAQLSVERAFSSNPDGLKKEALIMKALNDPLVENYTWDHSARFTGFIVENTDKWFHEADKAIITQLKERYSAEKSEMIIELFRRRAFSIVNSSSAEDNIKEIEDPSQERIGQLAAEYLGLPSIWVTLDVISKRVGIPLDKLTFLLQKFPVVLKEGELVTLEYYSQSNEKLLNFLDVLDSLERLLGLKMSEIQPKADGKRESDLYAHFIITQDIDFLMQSLQNPDDKNIKNAWKKHLNQTKPFRYSFDKELEKPFVEKLIHIIKQSGWEVEFDPESNKKSSRLKKFDKKLKATGNIYMEPAKLLYYYIDSIISQTANNENIAQSKSYFVDTVYAILASYFFPTKKYQLTSIEEMLKQVNDKSALSNWSKEYQRVILDAAMIFIKTIKPQKIA